MNSTTESDQRPDLAAIERDRRGGAVGEIIAAIAGAIRSRYELVEDEQMMSVS